jgi:hypothetical protein
VAFSAVLASRSFVREAVMLTATECTAALPPAFREAREAKRAKGALSATLAVLLLGGFAGRCAISAAVILPTAPRTLGALAEAVAGRSAAPGLAAARGVVWSCAVGLGSLNVYWCSAIVKAFARQAGLGKGKPSSQTPQQASTRAKAHRAKGRNAPA